MTNFEAEALRVKALALTSKLFTESGL